MEKEHSLLKRIGPGFITAAVVLGPGSILASSRAGAEGEYGLIWLLACACVFMATFTGMGARLGCALKETPLQYVAEHWGRLLAFLVGVSGFLVTAGFQFGNNLGVAVAMAEITGTPLWIWPLIFTGISLVFLLTARHVYQFIERLIIVLVVVMLASFVANLFWTGVSPVSLVRGLPPRGLTDTELVIGSAILATTFSAVAAFYQSYLVQAKGWRRESTRIAITDARIGITVLGCMALVIMISAAESLHGKGGDFESVGELARQLEGVLGSWAILIFCFGLAAASFSSFIANALIGGALFSDGVGLDADLSGWPVKGFTSAVMVVGCLVAVATSLVGRGSTTSLIIAQASTLVAAPLCAILLYCMSSSKRIMGDMRNGWPSLIIGACGLLVMAYLTFNLFRRVSGL